MKTKIFLITPIILFVFMSVVSLNRDKSGMKKMNYTLENEESVKVTEIVKRLMDETNKEELISSKSHPLLNSVIIRAFETENNNSKDFITYANNISKNRGLNYWSTSPWIYYGNKTYSETSISGYHYAFRNWDKSGGFEKYYHSIFENKKARSILFNQAVEIISSLCKKYPADFKDNVIEELNQLLKYSNNLSPSYSVGNTRNLRNYWEGFIYRRYKTDKISKEEIQSSLNIAINKIKSINTSNQPDVICEITINNHLILFISANGFSIKSKLSTKEILFDKGEQIEEIKYLKDDTGDYYLIKGKKRTGNLKSLYDKYLKLIM